MVQQYLDLVKDTFTNEDSGFKQGSKGSGLISYFGGPQARYSLGERWPLLTTKKMATKAMIHETLWFLSGDTNIKYLEDNKCKVWRGNTFDRNLSAMVKAGIFPDSLLLKENKYSKDWDKAMLDYAQMIRESQEFANKFGDAGPIYGYQLRHWPKFIHTGKKTRFEGHLRDAYVKDPHGIDQLSETLEKMKKHPQGKKNLVSYWNVADLPDMSLEPCHSFFQMTADESGRFFLKLYQRSSDIFLGVPFNTAAYWMQAKIFAHELGLDSQAFYHTFGDFHIYTGLEKRTQWYRENFGELKSKMKDAISKEKQNGDKQGYFDVLEWVNNHAPKDKDHPNDPEEEKYDHVTALLEQFTREIRPSPILTINYKFPNGRDKRYYELTVDDFVVSDYNPHPKIEREMLV
jgi:thymidylate synthase